MFTLALAAAKGGVGKTTLAAALCTAAQVINRSATVGLIDLDPQGSATHWWNRRALEHPILLDAGGTPPADAKRALQRTGMDLLVLDCPPGFSGILRPAIEAADLVIIPTGPSDLDLSAVAGTAEMARQAGRPYRFALNRAPFRSRIAGSAVRALRGDGLLLPPVHHRVAIPAPMAEGRTALEAEPGGAAARELWALWLAVCEALGMSPAVQPLQGATPERAS